MKAVAILLLVVGYVALVLLISRVAGFNELREDA